MAASPPITDVKVIIADDMTKVEMILPLLIGRDALAKQLCHAKLQEHKVEITETVVKAVDQLIAQTKNCEMTPQTPPVRGVVALATLPVHGKDGSVEWKLAQPDHPVAQDPQANSGDQPHNYYEDSIYTTVDKGVTVGILREPTYGIDGRDVQGKTIQARDGKPFDLQFDESLFRDAKGQLITQAQGVLIRSNNSVCVRKLIEVSGYVDFSTGNIDFSGDVIVNEGVRDCFIVKAEGNVTVKGLIEAATIITGGNLYAHGGMAGRERGTVDIGTDLHAKYLDNIQGTVGGNLCVEREAINCDLTVLGEVDSQSGSLIGGKLTARGKVVLDAIGSDADVRSDLVIGSVPLLDPILKKLEVFIQDLKDKRKKFAQEQDMIKSQGKRITASLKERQTELMFELMTIDTPLNKANDAYFRVNARAEDLRTVDVTIRRMLHAGSVLTVMGTSHKLRNDLRGSVHIFKDEKNEIVFKQGDGKLRLLASVSDNISGRG
jgi:uncharacterized protein (DUF342 family)